MGEKRRLEELWKLHPNTFRQDVGSGYVGGREYVAKKNGGIPVKKGDRVVINPAVNRFGLDVGSGDRVGWTEVLVSQEMVGKKVAIFTSIEDKSETDRISVEQIIWLLNVLRAGGIAKVYKELQELSLEEILKLPRREDKKNKTRILERMLNRER